MDGERSKGGFGKLFFRERMKTLLFLLLSLSVSAQTLTNRNDVIIYKSVLKDTVTVSFTPVGEATLTVKTYGETIDDKVVISGQHVLEIALDTAETITVDVKGTVTYKVTKKVVDVTPAPVNDNSLSQIKSLLQSSEGVAVNQLTTTQVRALLALVLYREGIIDENLKVKKLKQIVK